MADTSTTALLITTIGGLASLFVNQYFQFAKAKEERNAERQARQDDAAELKLQSEETARKIAYQTALTTAHLDQKIEANTKITLEAKEASAEAAKVANHVNDKLIAANDRVSENIESTKTQVDIGLDTNQRVKEIQQVVDPNQPKP